MGKGFAKPRSRKSARETFRITNAVSRNDLVVHLRRGPRKPALAVTEIYPMQPILCSQAAAGKMLAIGKTKLGELIADGVLESVRIGKRRLVKISSLQRLAGVEPGGEREA